MKEPESKKKSRGEQFIQYIIKMIASSKAKAAALKRADNPSLEYQSWEILNRFGIDLTDQQERSIFCLIAAAAAKAKVEEDGSLGIGEALANCYENKFESGQACTKLRRLIACDSITELYVVLRPMLQFISSKIGPRLCYARLLDELIKFNWQPLKVKSSWAQKFYFQKQIKEKEEEEENDVC